MKICLHCGKKLEKKRLGRKKRYCSDSCRVSAYKMRLRFTDSLARQSPYNMGQYN